MKLCRFLLSIILLCILVSCSEKTTQVQQDSLAPVRTPEEERYITSMTANPDIIYADYGLTWSEISVTVKDGNNDPVQHQLVSFRTNLGQCLLNAATDSLGVARSTFWAWDEAGIATITAFARNYDQQNTDVLLSADTCQVQVFVYPIPGTPQIVHRLEFITQSNIDLNVANTYGVDTAVIRVKLYDMFNNVITTPRDVWFRFADEFPPSGVTLNNYSAPHAVKAVSNNGIAQVILRSGTRTGTVNVKAFCFVGDHIVSSIKSNIHIYPGAPHQIDVSAGGNNCGIIQGNGIWKLVIAAEVKDIYGNPVCYGASVWFQLPEDLFGCTIQTNGYVGNESVCGDSLAGVAYTTLTYHGDYSNEKVKVRAVTGGANGMEVLGESYITLPVNRPLLVLEIIPGNIIFHGNYNPTPKEARADIYAYVYDLQGCHIHNARVKLSSHYGDFEYIPGTNEDPLNCNQPVTPNIIVTDWYDPYAETIPGDPTTYTDVPDGQDGIAQGRIILYVDDIPLGDPMTGSPENRTPGILYVAVYGKLLGTHVTSATGIVLIRYPT